MSSLNTKNTAGLMYLSGGVLTLLLITFFTVNAKTNLNPSVGAHRQNSKVGILRKDSMHRRVCNQVAKAEYVLEDGLDASKCMPVVANPSQAEEHVNREVVISGDSASGQYFAVDFTRVSKDSVDQPDMTPRATFGPRPSIRPVKTPSTFVRY